MISVHYAPHSHKQMAVVKSYQHLTISCICTTYALLCPIHTKIFKVAFFQGQNFATCPVVNLYHFFFKWRSLFIFAKLY